MDSGRLLLVVPAKEKLSLSLEERARFIDAPVIMDFRRSTEDNPEDNCQYYNKVQLRIMARETNVPVLRWEATYDGASQEEGQKLDSQYFNGLEHEVECAVGARILLIHNLAVAHGLMNGTQGIV